MNDRNLTVHGRDISGQSVGVTIAGGAIQRVLPIGPDEPGPDDLWIIPGLVDIQVNGFGGHDLNAPGTSPDDVAAVVRALWRYGVTRFCPTVCTQSRAHMIAALRTVARACEEAPWIDRAVIGVHVEGPYISPEDGPRGAHPREHVRPPNWDEVQAFQDAAGGRIRLLTLAPELPGAIDLVERLSETGIVPAIGHTGAGRADILAAASAGARLSTHLGNGSHAMIHRHHNYIWEQLAADSLWASLIADGHHLPPSVIKVFVRAKGVERCLLTSDAVWLAGGSPGTYRFLDREVELTPDHRVRLVGTEYLAGSALDLATAVGNVVAFAGIGLGEAVEMASLRPALLLGRTDLGRLAPGHAGDVVLARWLADEARLEVVQTVAGGEIVFHAC